MKAGAVVLAGCLLSCHGPAEPVAQPVAVRPIFSFCLLGNAHIGMTRRSLTPTGGSPALSRRTVDASSALRASSGSGCAVARGRASGAHVLGRAMLRCPRARGSMSLRTASPPGASWDEGFGATCKTEEQADQLMLSHCLKDVHLASTSGKAGL